MYCQKCRAPLRLDTSLSNISPTAFNLLVEASGKAAHQGATPTAGSRPLYNNEQKNRYEDAAQNAGSPIFKLSTSSSKEDGSVSQIIPDQANARDPLANPAMSFVMLTESQVVPPTVTVNDLKEPDNRRGSKGGTSSKHGTGVSTSKESRSGEENSHSHQTETSTRLFEILSSRSDIDHPVCAECTDLLIEGLEKQLANATKERVAYAEFLKNANADLPTDEERQQAEEELTVAVEQEKAALAELEQLEAEKSALEAELATLDRESRELDEAENQYWCERNAFAETVASYRSEKESISLRYDHDSEQLEKLSRTNVFNDTFCISSTKTGFATINNLRLGRSKDVTVPWAEVNAAWGMTLLLLSTIAIKLDFTFKGYVLRPMGSTSTIEKVNPSPQASTHSANVSANPSPSASQSNSGGKGAVTSLPLYHSGDFPLTIGFLHRQFDAAMIAFLECVRQLGQHVQPNATAGATSGGGGEEGLKLPFDIVKDRVGDVSIRLPTFVDGIDNWNTACKRILTCCKFLLAHTSKVSMQRKNAGTG